VVGTIFRGIRKALNPEYKSELELLREDVDTLDRVVRVVVKSLRALPPIDKGRTSDRATDAFVTQALEAALESPFEAKQVLLGRLIAERLGAETESADDLFLREALRIIRQSNQAQLFALGALYLVHHPPVSFMPHEAMREWWDTDYLPLLQRMVADNVLKNWQKKPVRKCLGK
jgi:hypothetical protein